MTRGLIFDISEMTLHDGPGLRTTVFFKGCPLRCLWCHNPEGLDLRPTLMARQTGCQNCGRCRTGCTHAACQPFGRCIQACPRHLLSIAGEWAEAGELAARLKQQSEILLMNGGGITLSGGEPLAQPAFLMELLCALKPLHTVVETSGCALEPVFQEMAALCDLVYLDIKHTDPAVHRRLTGADPALIQRNLAWLKSSGRPFTVRATMIPGLNDDAANLAALAELLRGSVGLTGVELLPYNPLAGAKYKAAGVPWRMPGQERNQEPALARVAEPVPDVARNAALIAIFTDRGIPARIL